MRKYLIFWHLTSSAKNWASFKRYLIDDTVKFMKEINVWCDRFVNYFIFLLFYRILLRSSGKFQCLCLAYCLNESLFAGSILYFCPAFIIHSIRVHCRILRSREVERNVQNTIPFNCESIVHFKKFIRSYLSVGKCSIHSWSLTPIVLPVYCYDFIILNGSLILATPVVDYLWCSIVSSCTSA